MKTKNDYLHQTKTSGGSPEQSTIAGRFYSESERNFSNFAINSLSTFAPIFSESKSEADDSESDFSSVNLDICLDHIKSRPYICILLNKICGLFFLSVFKTESIVMQANNTYFLLAYHYPKNLFLSPC